MNFTTKTGQKTTGKAIGIKAQNKMAPITAFCTQKASDPKTETVVWAFIIHSPKLQSESHSLDYYTNAQWANLVAFQKAKHRK